MEILQQKRALDVLYDLFALRPGKTQYVKNGPQKIPFVKSKNDNIMPLPTAAPESLGMKSREILKLFQNLDRDRDVNLHTLIIMRHGKLAAEISWKPYSADMWHCTHSMCKTLTAVAVGILIDEEKLSLDTPIIDFFPDVKRAPFQKYKNITVDHLLSMSSGVSFSEVGSVTDEDWTKGFFESAVKFEPGTEFAYNSMNSYLLSAIVTVITGETLSEFLAKRLFAPLGITNYHWESSPTGITKGGWGLYLLPHDMAKFGSLILSRGVWRGRRIVSEEWISKMCEKTFDTPPAMGRYGYARHIWCGARKGSVNCNGLFGQNITVYPDLDAVVVTTGAVDSLFQTCKMSDIIEEFFKNDDNFSSSPMPLDRDGERELAEFCRERSLYPEKENEQSNGQSFFGRLFRRKDKESSSVPEFCRSQNGVKYTVLADNVSIIPIFCQLIQNNYDVGITSLGFSYDKDKDIFSLLIENGNSTRSVPVGFDKAEIFDYDLNGELFTLGVTGRLTENEDGTPTLKIRIACLEIAAERNIKIFFESDDTVTVKWSETPGRKLILDAFDHFMKPTLERPIIGAIAAKTDGDYLLYRLDRVIEPVTQGKKAVSDKKD